MERSDYPANLSLGQGMTDFEACITQSEIFDIPYKGFHFTWCNKSSSHPLAVKLDRAMGNDSWQEAFPDAYAEFAAPGPYDHSPIILHMPSIVTKVIRDCWNVSEWEGSRQFGLCKTLKALKGPLRVMNKNNFSGITQRVKGLTEELKLIQQRLFENPSPEHVAEEQTIRAKWVMLVAAEESFFRQKSRLNWLAMGDKNTRFFHKVVKGRTTKNHIYFLEDQDGQRLQSPTDIKRHAEAFFTRLIGTRDNSVEVPSVEWLRQLMPYSCSPEDVAE
ncbi:PREDICTED: uncharacterized protein LOC104825355 [Tarenaya hassleriana]|uniref:uncharacterized protein LOC104825355 n=1 Tax=Tarenaya hassleriana TaxID=28532 RepID=UPI00053C9518|nr:PREDICTED: uncharacterized protein LOC104825355 [Tarenaya hassleriana]